MSVLTTLLDPTDRPKGVALTGYRAWVIVVIVLVTTPWQEFGFSVMFRR